jgi:hypothetical protein
MKESSNICWRLNKNMSEMTWRRAERGLGNGTRLGNLSLKTSRSVTRGDSTASAALRRVARKRKRSALKPGSEESAHQLRKQWRAPADSVFSVSYKGGMSA